MNSYDGIDYELITSYYNCEYFYLTGADIDSILFTKRNNKRTIYIIIILMFTIKKYKIKIIYLNQKIFRYVQFFIIDKNSL